MKTLCFANNKGGVGKTSSALNVGYALAHRGYRVLFCDCDPQRNLSQSFGQNLEGTHLGDLLMLKGEFTQDDVRVAIHPVTELIGLLPSHPKLAAYEPQIGHIAEARDWIKEILDLVADEYDYCILDTPPSLGNLVVWALIASDLLFIPVQPELYGYEGLSNIAQAVTRMHAKLNPRLRVGGIFFTKYSPLYRRRLHHDVVELISSHFGDLGPVLTTSIRENVSIANAQMAGASLFDFAPESNGALDYAALTDEILSELNVEKSA